MESKLSLSEFRTRLVNNTQIGSPKLKLSPFSIFTIFNGTSKPFYGLFDDKSFRLTLNSTINPTFFIIKGRYKIQNRALVVNYNIEPCPKFYLTWIKWIPIFVGGAMNLLLFFSKETPKEVYMLVNIVIALMIFFSRWDTKEKRKNIEENFIKIFEIME
ncbi:hypothetical protein [Flavobacterium pectinovorum]|jgi:hypothetical protein|uniref:Uncharacterized protein n=1 Tax=Flavobacterium pectinovorum TaxID=29533 RepID=A0A502F6W1_9FLAO|nr:hypothetical protein [Flavobacterium pectinovorum]TPG45109.1 hypothetical protein EAH81_00460 [Flavobacterium pectinovorum]